jgi:(1->4)-alpha-D-glucan 1-alpha-D-glucosylmutase
VSAPRATVRLQFNRDFTLDQAVPLVPYFARLGVSHVYASPLMAARAGSPHGYDIVDHGRLNPELGGEPALERLVGELRRHGMGLILDIVPNHMAVGGDDNEWWLDLLENGRHSRYAAWFDIDWTPRDRLRRGRILAPFLGSAYGECLARGEITLEADAESGKIAARYFAHKFPIRPESVLRLTEGGRRPAAEVLGDYDSREPEGRARLHTLLEDQHYRLCWWRVAGDEINWRRFFDINGLAGLRVELAEVFNATTRYPVDLYRRGLVDGLRIDHVDGLATPRQYCRKLRRLLDTAQAERPEGLRDMPAWLVVEKILQEGETLPADWLVDGTTGYDFMEQGGALLHDEAGNAALTALWCEASHDRRDFAALARQAKQEVLSASFGGDMARLVSILHRHARANPVTRDLTYDALLRVTTALLLHLPVYRLYAGRYGYSEADMTLLRETARRAEASVRSIERASLQTVGNWVGAEPFRTDPPGPARRLRVAAAARFEQLSGPLTAKGIEDTAFYRYGRLLSRNEVGGNPAMLSLPVEDFHHAVQVRQQQFPHAMLATATHDHKRGEDARARLAVLSEMAAAWSAQVQDWSARFAPLKPLLDGERAPHPADELMLYQTLVGAWPMRGDPDDGFTARVRRWQEKSLREGKQRSSWDAPDMAYEESCHQFLEALMQGDFVASCGAFVQRIAAAGALNGLVQTILRLTVPGVPDLYQGTEFWDLSLVDPDNRRPVDWPARAAALGGTDSLEELAASWQDGRIKQHLVQMLLNLRRADAPLLEDGSYHPLPVTGALRDRIIAFERRQGDRALVVIVARHLSALLAEPGGMRIAADRWGDTEVHLPRASRFLSVLQPGASVSGERVAASGLLQPLPFAVLLSA